MTITKKQIDSLSEATRLEMLFTLYRIEDELEYKCKSVSKAINYLQKGVSDDGEKRTDVETN